MNKSVNRYGLLVGYFRNLINRELSDLSNFTPDEFARVCARMAKTADSEVLGEPEFMEPQWVSVDKSDDYEALMVAGSMVFWHKIHKCEVTGHIVKNKGSERVLQGDYSVVEKTRTTAWPIEAFTHVRPPAAPEGV